MQLKKQRFEMPKCRVNAGEYNKTYKAFVYVTAKNIPDRRYNINKQSVKVRLDKQSEYSKQ